MNIATLKMPRLGETMEQGEIVGWLVEVGQAFERGQAILEVETDKTVVEYPALGAGTLREILAVEGDTVDVGAVIAKIDLGDEPDWTLDDQETEPKETETRPKPVVPSPINTSAAAGDRLRATPVARRLARNAGIALADINGTGRRGRIEGLDVEDALANENAGGIRFGHAIAHVATGPVSGRKFLLLHGFAGDHTAFSLLSNGLTKAGARVVSCDLPGHGATELKAADTDGLSQNLVELSRTLFGRKPYHLVAHSMGAIPAMALAKSVPPASLTLIAPAGFGPAGNADFLTGMAQPKSAKDVGTYLDMLTEKPNGLSQSAIEAVFKELSKGRLTALAQDLIEPDQNHFEDLTQLAKEIPIRILVGQNDRILHTLDPFKLPADIAFHSFADTGHMPHWDDPRGVLKIVLAAVENT